MRILPNRVQMIISDKTFSCTITVSKPNGLVEVDFPHFGDPGYPEILEILVENEFAEWRPIGPEDRELFATDKLLGYISPALDVLPNGWQDWG